MISDYAAWNTIISVDDIVKPEMVCSDQLNWMPIACHITSMWSVYWKYTFIISRVVGMISVSPP